MSDFNKKIELLKKQYDISIRKGEKTYKIDINKKTNEKALSIVKDN